MTHDVNNGIIHFKDKTYSLKALLQAVKKATVVCIEAGTEFHEHSFEVESFEDARHPVVTPYEGKMVIIGSRKLVPAEIYTAPEVKEGAQVSDKKVVHKSTKPFKAILVTKYSLNQSRIKDDNVVDVHKPIYESEPEVRRPFNPPKFVKTTPSSGRVSQYGSHHSGRKV